MSMKITAISAGPNKDVCLAQATCKMDLIIDC